MGHVLHLAFEYSLHVYELSSLHFRAEHTSGERRRSSLLRAYSGQSLTHGLLRVGGRGAGCGEWEEGLQPRGGCGGELGRLPENVALMGHPRWGGACVLDAGDSGAEPSSGRTLCLGAGRPASGPAGLWGQGRASPTSDAAGGRIDTGDGTAPLFQKVLEQGRLGLGGHASGFHRAQWAVMVGTRRTGCGPTVPGRQEVRDLLMDGSGQG